MYNSASVNVKGRISSVESMGGVDGPGIRYVVFMQGCPLRCIYCHNPETWSFSDGAETNTETLFNKIMRFKPYFKKGGVTLSGGEPLAQPSFCADLISRLNSENIHTAIDTAGGVSFDSAKKVLDLCNLVILDIKFAHDELYRKYTGCTIDKPLEILKYCQKTEKPVFVRQVILPKVNDSEADAKALADLLCVNGKNCIKKIELLPFGQHCTAKYENMGIDFPCRDFDAADVSKVNKLQKIIDDIFHFCSSSVAII